MVCDVSMLHIGYKLATDQLSVFVHTERLNFIQFYLVSLYVQKQTTDQLLICNKYVTLKRHKL